ncbi:Folylpolyglutamate synthase [Nesidiocoris tenuis]|uniref:Folylpolyglutamate synthase n=1 Tax=Nesidiocoris tenuis TaxID=355587 RepID=A0ABN7AX22_9HEMI|nr:Folylpolyglutamate synthase [Nesidiocoris tenuis]
MQRALVQVSFSNWKNRSTRNTPFLKIMMSHSSASSLQSYEDTIKTLNSLQSTASSINEIINRNESPRQSNNLKDSLKYLQRCGVSLTEFENTIPVIHVSGTKGKGSTCALCESILRAHGYRTGLYTSPHLICVRERIRLDGLPMSHDEFSKYFWDVYNRLNNNKEHETDMPMYFKFLTVMAFYVFLSKKVDVAIIEVGIGGEMDCTNILRQTPIVGITSLGLDHTKILGDTLEEIAWQKAGIIKPGSLAFTVPNHSPSALEVLKKRAADKGVELMLVPELSDYGLDLSHLSLTIQLNASLAIQLTTAWMKLKYDSNGVSDKLNGMIAKIDKLTLQGIQNCSWNGRFQQIKRGRHKLYLDGAHTLESANLCARWFDSTAPKNCKRVLLFNTTRGRNPGNLLQHFVNCGISTALFCTNVLSQEPGKIPQDLINKRVTDSDGYQAMQHNLEAWRGLQNCHRDEASSRPSITAELSSHTFDTVEEAIAFIDKMDDVSCHVLVTGSIHLVGAVLTLVQRESNNYNSEIRL